MLPTEEITAAFRLGSKPNSQGADRRNILLKMKREDTKRDILAACRTTKPNNLFIKDDLIPARAKILFALRQAKRRFPAKVMSCGSRDGSVFVWLRASGDSTNNNKMTVNNFSKLSKLCQFELNIRPSELLEGSLRN